MLAFFHGADCIGLTDFILPPPEERIRQCLAQHRYRVSLAERLGHSFGALSNEHRPVRPRRIMKQIELEPFLICLQHNLHCGKARLEHFRRNDTPHLLAGNQEHAIACEGLFRSTT